MPDRTSFLAAIAEAPDDARRWLVFADWLEEHGDPDLAYAYRWCAHFGRRPGRRANPRARKPWAWFRPLLFHPDDSADAAANPRAVLDRLAFRAVAGPDAGESVYYVTFAAALEALALGLRRLRDLIPDHFPDPPPA
jgi:uncharacterized protein (TIGR02996 family)